MRMKSSPYRLATALGLGAAAVSALSMPRRTFLGRLPIVASVAGVSATFLQHGTKCSCGNCGLAVEPAIAYERRDVGGEDASAVTKAMNLQAYETNNRLERQGLKLETAAEQSASLSAALSEYSYSPGGSTSSKSGNKGRSVEDKVKKTKN